MNPKKDVLVIFCSVLIILGICTSASAAEVTFSKGELETTFKAPFDKTFRATIDGLETFDWIWIHKTQKDNTGGIIEAWGKNRVPIGITLKSTGPDVTSVSIKIGVFGDEGESLKIREAILAQLKLMIKK